MKSCGSSRFPADIAVDYMLYNCAIEVAATVRRFNPYPANVENIVSS
jgi:hypothetical protein